MSSEPAPLDPWDVPGIDAAQQECWRAAMPLLDPAAWAGKEPPAREWALRDWIPARQASYLTGPGSAGKSLLAQQLCTCISLGLPFMGAETRQAVAMYVTCEDDTAELHRRQAAICEAIGAKLSSLSGKLHLVSLAGHIGTELATFGHGRDPVDEFDRGEPAMRTSKQWHALSGTARDVGAAFVALDNVAHLFAGNENIRNEVAAFVSLLNRLAMQIDGSVLLIGHPNKAGAQYSGSTAWENQVRSRLFLELQDENGDPDVRVLSTGKANYARTGAKLTFRWHRWAFVRDVDLPDDYRAELALSAQAAGENAAFLRCLEAATAKRRAVSHNLGVNYAPTIFSRMPEGNGFDRAAFERAFERLLHLSEIKLDQRLWQGENRHWKIGIAAAESCAKPGAPTPCAEPRQSPSQVIENTCANPSAPTPLYTTYNGRGPQGSAAPDSEEDGR